MCPGSHIRHAWGVTPGRESPEVQVPGGPALWGRGRLVQGCEQALGPQHQANRCSVVSMDHQELPFGGALNANCGFGSAEPVVEGRRPVSAGKQSDACTRRASRRMGGGTKARIGDSKRGRSPCQPRSDRMARARRITAKREVVGRAWRLAAEAVVAVTARTTQPRSSEGPLGEPGVLQLICERRALRGRRLGERPGVVPLAAITRLGAVLVWAACLRVMSRGGGEGGRPTQVDRAGWKGGSVRPPHGPCWGTRPLRCARFQPYRGKPYVRLIGGREETGASRACIAVRRAAPPAYPAQGLPQRHLVEGLGRGPC